MGRLNEYLEMAKNAPSGAIALGEDIANVLSVALGDIKFEDVKFLKATKDVVDSAASKLKSKKPVLFFDTENYDETSLKKVQAAVSKCKYTYAINLYGSLSIFFGTQLPLEPDFDLRKNSMQTISKEKVLAKAEEVFSED